MSKRYSQFFDGDDYHNITDNYIKSLIDFSYQGWWFYDLYDKGPRMYYFFQIVNHLYRKIAKGKLRILSNEFTYCTHPSEAEFMECTRKYVADLLHALNKENKDYLEIDQIVPSSNIVQFLRYFEDEVFVFIVDRDPRDIYLLGKYYWKDGICPWYSYARKAGRNIDIEDSRIIKLKFEDIIYHYDNTVNHVEEITGLDSKYHTHMFEKMNPKRSVVNTRLWEKHPDDKGIEIITKNLPEYLYDYSAEDTMNIRGVEVINTSNF